MALRELRIEWASSQLFSSRKNPTMCSDVSDRAACHRGKVKHHHGTTKFDFWLEPSPRCDRSLRRYHKDWRPQLPARDPNLKAMNLVRWARVLLFARACAPLFREGRLGRLRRRKSIGS